MWLRPPVLAGTALRHNGRVLSTTPDLFGRKTGLFREKLGQPIPLDEHACSVSMPFWEDVVGYEEGCERVRAALACGYPRFVYHPHVEQLCATILHRATKKRASVQSGPMRCSVAPTFLSALRMRDFLLEESELSTEDVYVYSDEIINQNLQMHVHSVMYPCELADKAKAYWQHTGEVVSSRQANDALTSLGETPITITPAFCSEQRVHCAVPSSLHETLLGNDTNGQMMNSTSAFDNLRASIAGYTSASPTDVYLAPSGMGAISLGLRVAQAAFQRSHQSKANVIQNAPLKNSSPQAVVFGFPYLDTLKLCQRKELSPGGYSFFEFGNDADLRALESLVKRGADPNDPTSPLCAVFTEFPSNPLLRSPDLHRLKSILQEYDVPLIVDDTISNFSNTDLFASGENCKHLGADVIVTSLTKLYSGRGDVMGGSMVLNPASKLYKNLKFAAEEDQINNRNLQEGSWEGLYASDAAALCINSRDFEKRSGIINETAMELVEHVAENGYLDSLYYPALTITNDGVQESLDELYARYMKPSGGPGSLFSVVFDEDKVCPKTFYDSLAYSKGPSLGTNFTLCSPYTLLAHYGEQEWAAKCGVQSTLIRVSVGLEDVAFLKDAWTKAVKAARK